jgi:hypothetical protein
MKIAIILATHLDCEVRVDLLRSMIFSATVAQLHAQNVYPDVETRILVRLSCVDGARSLIEKSIQCGTLPKLVIHERQSQFQKIRSEVDSAAMNEWDPDYYLFLDDDDIVSPLMMENYVKYLLRVDSQSKVIIESDIMHDLSNFDTTTLLWKDVDIDAHYDTHSILRTNFSGICCSSSMISEFLDIFQNEIDSGVGTVDLAFTSRLRRDADYHIYIPIPLMYYRQWENPRSWNSLAPETQDAEDIAMALGGTHFTSDIDLKTDNGIDLDGDGDADIYVGPDNPAAHKLQENIQKWHAAIIDLK